MTDTIGKILAGGAFSRQQATALRQLLGLATGVAASGDVDGGSFADTYTGITDAVDGGAGFT